MTSEIKAVLLVPTEGDPHGLLREGPCGARPPMVVRVRGRWINPWVRPSDADRTILTEWAIDEIALPTALVIAWDGEPVAEGLDRLGRAPAVTREWVSHVVGVALGWWPGDVDVLTDHQLPGTLVLLDAERAGGE